MRTELPAVLGSAREARRLVKGVGGIPAERLEVVQLIVSELVTNAVQHAGLRASDTFTLTVEWDDAAGCCRVEVDDGGSFSAHPGVRRHPRLGYGLKVVSALSERWEAEQGRTVAWVAI